jgi:hypothetical protein
VAADRGDGRADAGTDEAAVKIGRLDVLGATGKAEKAKAKRKDEFLRHVESSGIRRVRARSSRPHPSELGSVAARLADADRAAERATSRADERAGADIAVDDFRDGRTGDGATSGALNVRRDAAHAAAVAALIASGEAAEHQGRNRKTKNDGFMHSDLPV